MKSILKIDDVYLFQNEDSIHGFHFWLFPRQPWMERFGRKIESVKPIMRFAEENMMTPENIAHVKDCVAQMKTGLSQ